MTETATALSDLSRGITYTEVARRAQVNHGLTFGDVPDALAVSGATVAGWLDRYGPAIIAAHREAGWPETIVLASAQFLSTDAFTGRRLQMFTVLAAWGYPAGALAGASDRGKTRPAGANLDEQARFLLDGSRE